MQYRTKDGEVIDAICHRYYGRSDATVQVYELNPGLGKWGPVLPAGLLIELPDIKEPKTAVLTKISLFD